MSCSETLAKMPSGQNTGLTFCGVFVRSQVRLAAELRVEGRQRRLRRPRGIALGHGRIVDRRRRFRIAENEVGRALDLPADVPHHLVVLQGDLHRLFEREIPDVAGIAVLQRPRPFRTGHVGQPFGLNVGILDLGRRSLVIGQVVVGMVLSDEERLLRAASRQNSEDHHQGYMSGGDMRIHKPAFL